jgi:hypothetical protein
LNDDNREELEPWNLYKAGDESGRFFSKEALIDAARACWKQHFPDALLLIEGDQITLGGEHGPAPMSSSVRSP